MNWVPVKSRMLLAVSYDHDWRQLYLKFRSGDIYCYRGVPVERYEELVPTANPICSRRRPARTGCKCSGHPLP